MNVLKNIVYLGYYIKKTDWKRLGKYMSYTEKKTGKKRIILIGDMLCCTLSLGTSFYEYYYYGFAGKNRERRREYASMGFMYEYQKSNNSIKTRTLLEDKLLFYVAYAEFIGRYWLEVEKASDAQLEEFIKQNKKAVIKGSTSGAGQKVKVLELCNFSSQSLRNYMSVNGFDMIEEFVNQHSQLAALAPNSLNTIRVITQLDTSGKVDIIGAVLRMSIYENTDNLTTGGIAARINIENGVIEDAGISFDITHSDYTIHPVSGISITGFKIPYWKEAKQLCIKAAKMYPENKSIGWDVAIKSDGPILIEGNHDWGARLWQMPERKGLKAILLRYC